MADKTIEICTAMFDFDSDERISPTQFRGFMAHLFSNISEFHHHSDNNYHYPLIQYKRVQNKIAIIGIGNYADIVSSNMADIEHITTETQKIPIKNIQINNSVYSIVEKLSTYGFSAPWIALNEENYAKYKQASKSDKRKLLEKILVGNILSMFKGLGIFVPQKIEVNILRHYSKPITVHDNKFVGFGLDFACNVVLPEYVGLGKSVSKGFGVIKKKNVS
ncbi:MAG: CRISPR-associated endonuclease Cas6 [Candidatus Nitrosotenuis sp.]